MPAKIQIFTFLFLMLGPFKLIGPYAKITMGADPSLANRIAVRAIVFSSVALLIAGALGKFILDKYGIPVPILGLSGGIILFLVALLNVIKQFSPSSPTEVNSAPPTLSMALSPLAFPVIVTPYGIAAVIVFLAFCPDLKSRIAVALIVLLIMALNLIIMLITRYIYKFLAVFLAILGAILGVVQVALGLNIIYNQLRSLLEI